MKRPYPSPVESIKASRELAVTESVNPVKKKRDDVHLRVRQARLRLLSRQRRSATKIARNV